MAINGYDGYDLDIIRYSLVRNHAYSWAHVCIWDFCAHLGLPCDWKLDCHFHICRPVDARERQNQENYSATSPAKVAPLEDKDIWKKFFCVASGKLCPKPEPKGPKNDGRRFPMSYSGRLSDMDLRNYQIDQNWRLPEGSFCFTDQFTKSFGFKSGPRTCMASTGKSEPKPSRSKRSAGNSKASSHDTPESIGSPASDWARGRETASQRIYKSQPSTALLLSWVQDVLCPLRNAWVQTGQGNQAKVI